MNNVLQKLSIVSSRLSGEKLIDEELNRLMENYPVEYPKELISLQKEYNLIGLNFSLDDDQDKSGLGAEIQWMDGSEQIEESRDFYPGKLAVLENYLPFGKCLEGSGDPYFFSFEKEWKVFRIPHDSVEDSQIDIDQVEFICNLVDLFDFIDLQ